MADVKSERLWQVLRAPHTSEKTTRIAEEHRQITFRVLMNATKAEIKQAVETIFKVRVTAVNVQKQRGKQKRVGRVSGRRQDWKKACVTLAPGEDINFIESSGKV